MSDQNESKRPDAGEVLDKVLARYAGEPLIGFEERIVRRVRQRQLAAPNRFGWLRTMNPVAALASVVAIAALSVTIGVRIGEQRANAIWQRRTEEMKISLVAKKPALSSAATAETQVPPSHRVERVIKDVPRLERHRVSAAPYHAAHFPTPAPLTAQEKALAAVASRGGPKLVSSLVLTTATTSEPDDKVNPDEMHDQK